MFSRQELRRLAVSERIVVRIGKKHRGGQSGSAGYRQEDFFAVCKMLTAARRHIEHGEHFWMIQNAEALVDDLVTGNGTHGFYQVKTSPSASWASLHADFRDQAELCELYGLQRYQLFLVVSSTELRSRLARQRPRQLKRTSVVFFPKMARTSDLAAASGPAFEDLRALCAGRASSGDIAGIAACAFMAVLDRPAKPKRYPVEGFLRELRMNPSVPVREPFVDTSPLWSRAMRVLGRIPDLTVSISDGFFVFDYRGGLETGRAVKCGTAGYRRLLQRIVRAAPTSFDELERLLG